MSTITWINVDVASPQSSDMLLVRFVDAATGRHGYSVCCYHNERWWIGDEELKCVVPRDIVATHWTPISEPIDLREVLDE